MSSVLSLNHLWFTQKPDIHTADVRRQKTTSATSAAAYAYVYINWIIFWARLVVGKTKKIKNKEDVTIFTTWKPKT